MNGIFKPAPAFQAQHGLNDDQVDQLIARARPNHCLERAFYCDPAVFERDLEGVFARHWLFAGHASRIPRAGDYFQFSLAGESIIVIRQPDGGVRAFWNVCRHRGSRVLLDDEGTAKKLVCPYHAWTYATNGELLACRSMPDDFDKSCYGLKPCEVRERHGLIFVNLADDPTDPEPLLEAIDPFLEPFELAQTRICRRSRHIVQANWKLVAENFWECYHCGHTHPEFCSVMSYARGADSKRLAAEHSQYVAEWQAEHLNGRPASVELPEWGLQCHRLPIQRGFKTQSQDGQPVAPLLGQRPQFDGGVVGIMWRPLLWFVVCNDHAMLARFLPVAPMETEAEFTWLVRSDAEPGRDYDEERVAWLWTKTGSEDWTICENNQAGVNSRMFQPGPYSTQEASVADFVAWYLSKVGELNCCPAE